MDRWYEPDFNLRSLRVADLKRILQNANVEYPVYGRKADYLQLVERLRKRRAGGNSISVKTTPSDFSSTSSANSNLNSDNKNALPSSRASASSLKSTQATGTSRSSSTQSKPSLSRSSSSSSSSPPTETEETAHLSSFPTGFQFPHTSKNNTFQSSVLEGSPNVETSITLTSPPPLSSTPKFRPHASPRDSFPISSMDSSTLQGSPRGIRKLKPISSSSPRQTPGKPIVSPRRPFPSSSNGSLSYRNQRSPVKETQPISRKLTKDNPLSFLDDDLDSSEEDALFEDYVHKQDHSNYTKRSLCSKLARKAFRLYSVMRDASSLPNFFHSQHRIHPPQVLTIVLGIFVAIFLTLWREEVYRAGFCDVPSSGNSTILQKFGLGASCTPCPSHSKCLPNFELQCDSGYILSEPWYSRFGLWPKKKCVGDTNREESVTIFYEECLDVLRTWNSILQCGRLSDDLIEKNKTLSKTNPYVFEELKGSKMTHHPLFSIALLRHTLLEKKSPNLSLGDFNDLFKAALYQLANAEEIEINEENIGSHSWANVPLRCRLRRQVYRTIWKYKFTLLLFILVTICLYKAYTYFYLRKKVQKYLPFASRFCIDSLKRQKALYQSSRTSQPVVPLIEMHDLLLHSHGVLEQSDLTEKEGQLLWDSVVKKVEQVGSIRTREAEVDGEWTRVWEWVGTNPLDPLPSQ
ncbi:LEM domain-containing protein Heh1/Lem2 [Schizosaccharomyces cryophilus OY26]|uniref:LEM domain-containing protein Heh1/Lem2 n=1 Tax=Schizosaccharomyces cryophilus (strain OY26 / ATCC MYA-4695 / CBS 11777 / NBRC 106824 / NRRL Y48691) TaxID=653667 RepID=S9VZU5_SCHCR|nr:LEM domain-containing protein Heh1/Lem2 [Schizosaccharomyces cryophilus OY26]EPY51789.1 LEM domain-containing protein Heh1/Lem2 [Schizosaccharomyces cryophilus OY26]